MDVEHDEAELKPQKRFANKSVKTVSIITALIISIIAGFVILGLFINRTGDEPMRVGNRLVGAVIANNVEAAFAETGADFRKSTNQQQLSERLDELRHYFKNGRYSIIDRASFASPGQPAIASIVYTIRANDSDYYLRVLVEEETTNNWKVTNFMVSKNELKASNNI